MPETPFDRWWPSLHDAAVRDLAWLLDSPDLFGPAPGAIPAQPWTMPGLADWTRDWLIELDRVPAPLHRVIDEIRPTRLGRYAELLLGYFLTRAEGLTLLAANLPLRSQGRTIGECDYLLETEQGMREHWELAVKCYLCAPHEGALLLNDFVGPGLADRLDLKYHRMVEHQLRLTSHEAFATLGMPGPWQPRMYVKGWLFYRGDMAPAEPTEISAWHGRGFWVTRGAWHDWAAMYGAGIAWSVLPRLAWLAPKRLESAAAGEAHHYGARVSAPQTAEALSSLFPEKETPIMVAGFECRADGAWHEIMRGFVVPDDWAEEATAYARA